MGPSGARIDHAPRTYQPRRPPDRARALTLVLVAVIGLSVVAITALRANRPGAQGALRPTAEATVPVRHVAERVSDPARVVDIVAHPDDDLFFMNPGLRRSVRDGSPLTTVYLTSGARATDSTWVPRG
ncbi:PIG-L family deacetylase [Streptomyces sp. NPDC056519]|uniref:PIG-L family deacetylase n=1 Tax=Streptomyces sp. NPDC056519 TaxID=3345849 RepID=UPI003689DCC8